MDRTTDLSRARILSIASVVWGAVAAVAGIMIGLAAGSLSLLGFGFDSAIDSMASVALVWRFHIEASDPDRAERVEHLADRVVGAVLIMAALALMTGAVRALLAQGEIHEAPGQLALLFASLAILPPLALSKRRVAIRLGSQALRNDALLTGAAAVLALVALGALMLSDLGLWWSDAAGSIVIAAVLAREGWSSVGWGRDT